MRNMSSRKLRLIFLIEILKKHSDAEHPITASEIIKFLAEKGITCERKSVYNTISTLLGYGWDIKKSFKPKKGFYLGKRDFETAEIKLLSDAVLSANFITTKKSTELLTKLKNQLSVYQSEFIHIGEIKPKKQKIENDEFYKNIELINKAIRSGNSISFKYYHTIIKDNMITTDNGRDFYIYPKELSWTSYGYFIIGLDRTSNKVRSFHVDRIKKLTIKENTKINLNKEKTEIVEIIIICSNSLYESAIDEFANYATIKNYSNTHFKLCLNMPICKKIILWVIENSENLYVKEPFELRKKIREKIQSLYEVYFNKRVIDC